MSIKVRAISKSDKHHIHLDIYTYLGQMGSRLLDIVYCILLDSGRHCLYTIKVCLYPRAFVAAVCWPTAWKTVYYTRTWRCRRIGDVKYRGKWEFWCSLTLTFVLSRSRSNCTRTLKGHVSMLHVVHCYCFVDITCYVWSSLIGWVLERLKLLAEDIGMCCAVKGVTA